MKKNIEEKFILTIVTLFLMLATFISIMWYSCAPKKERKGETYAVRIYNIGKSNSKVLVSQGTQDLEVEYGKDKYLDLILREYDSIHTTETSRALVEIKKIGKFVLYENSFMIINSGNSFYEDGKILNLITKIKKDTLYFQTITAVVGVRGTIFFIEVDYGNKGALTKIKNIEGILAIKNIYTTNSFILNKNEKIDLYETGETIKTNLSLKEMFDIQAEFKNLKEYVPLSYNIKIDINKKSSNKELGVETKIKINKQNKNYLSDENF